MPRLMGKLANVEFCAVWLSWRTSQQGKAGDQHRPASLCSTNKEKAMGQHQPGPWSRDKYGHVIDANGKDVQFRSVNILCSGGAESMAIAEANTDLATAAPELLRALKLCAAVCAGETSHKQGLIDALEAARSALKNAAGT